jgi:DNA replication protein
MSGERLPPRFPDRLAFLPVPVGFFGSLLRDVDSLAELKLTLHCWRLLQQQKGYPRFVQRSALAADRTLLQMLRTAATGEPAAILGTAIEAACARGTLLCLEVEAEGGPDACYFLNTAANQQVIQRIQSGQQRLGPLKAVVGSGPPPALPRPGIYELYEQNVGLLTPLIAEELREAEATYPAEWIEDAFREAVAYNKRNWRYIRRILDTWATRGRGERGENRGHPQPPEDAGRYLQGRYGRLLKR